MKKSFIKKMSKWNIFSFIIITTITLLVGFPRFVYSQFEGYKFYKNYSNLDYNHFPQNWEVAQAENGFLYIANQGGILEYDGYSWRLISRPQYAEVRSLAINTSGAVYVGGKNDFGYLAPDENGTLKYISLVEYVEKKYRNFSTVWNTHATHEGIYFRTTKYLFRWNSQKITILDPKDNIYGSYYCNNQLFLVLGRIGLVKLVNDSFEKIPGGEEIKYVKRLFMIVPYDPQHLLIGTISSKRSFFVYDGQKIDPFPVEAQEYLNKLDAYHGIKLTNGDYAVATRMGGLVILGTDGDIKKTFDTSHGLQTDMARYVFQDKQENLWLCLDNGISKIEYASQFSILDKRSGLFGLALSTVRSGETLFVGTTRGVYYLEAPFRFRQISGVSSTCTDIMGVPNGILAATNGGLYYISKNKTKRMMKIPSKSLSPSKRYQSRIWCGTSEGLLVLEKEGATYKTKEIIKTAQEIKNIVEDTTGNLWLATSTGTIIHADMSASLSHPSLTHFENSDGLPEGELDIAWAAGHLMVATTKGIYRFDQNSRKFIPDLTLAPAFIEGSKPVFRIFEDENENIWIHSESRNYLAIPGSDGSYKILSEPFLRIPVTAQVNQFYYDSQENITWFSTNDGLYGYNPETSKRHTEKFHTYIRKISINEKKLIFDGCRQKIKNGNMKSPQVFTYNERNIGFEFAAPYFVGNELTLFQSYLEGYDNDWSSLNRDGKRYYTNLNAGEYTFRVRAQNAYGRLGIEDSYRFKILPPFYRTWWAYIIYILGLFLFIFVVVKWRAGRLEREKKKLEYEVAVQTKKVREKNIQLEDQTKQLKEQSTKLEQMNQMKSRFFANISHEFRTPLTLIMSPLGEMRDNCRNPEQKEEFNLMLRSSRRLLTLINQLLDLSRFDSGKMKLQSALQDIVSFLKGIAASFNTLARKAQLSLEFHSSVKEISLYFDRQKMEEAIINLVINAIKFTPPGGKITVSVSQEKSQEGEKIKISVKDTGIGISNEQMHHIFDRFYQAEGLKEKSHKGTGIGLALAKDIIELHSGIINVHSRENEGTEFVVLLPMGREHLVDDQIVSPPPPDSGQFKILEVDSRFTIHREINEVELDESFEEPGNEEIDESEEDEVLRGTAGKKSTEGNHSEEQKKNKKKVILIVEDDPDVRKYIRGPLRKEYRVLEAADGKEGIEAATKFMPDLIVSDIMMPEMNGLEMCVELRNNIATSHIPIILLTAKAADDHIIEGLETGADDYITKPFNTKILLARIKNLIDLRLQFQKKIQRQQMMIPDEISFTPLDQEFLDEFKKIVQKNYTDPEFTIDGLCETLELGRSTLFKKIKALLGVTPNQYILSYRLERGAQLLKQHYGNVTDIAMKVGFSSPAYFAKCFKDKFHLSPSDFQATELKPTD